MAISARQAGFWQRNRATAFDWITRWWFTGSPAMKSVVYGGQRSFCRARSRACGLSAAFLRRHCMCFRRLPLACHDRNCRTPAENKPISKRRRAGA
eukprot:12418362-Karenia_brevis.AAC.1